MPDAFLAALLRKVLKDNLTPFFQGFAHFGRKVEIRLKTKRARDVMEKGSFDRDGVYYVLAQERAAELFGHPDAVFECCDPSRGIKMFLIMIPSVDLPHGRS